jgi:signal transduction histidine kinase
MLEISLQQEKEGREIQANLLALMTHEVRSPIAVISNTAQMLNALAQTEKPDWQPRIEKIMGAVRQLAQLMDNVLAEDRLSLNSSGLEFQVGDLNVFCAELVDKLAISHSRTIRYAPYNGDARLRADWQLIGIAIGNLIDNAAKYSLADSEIGVRLVPGNPGTLCVEVSDHGMGIAPELQKRVFEKFIRGQHESGISGNGLGLFLVSWIARFHGGYAEVFSTPGEGSTFRLCVLLREP